MDFIRSLIANWYKKNFQILGAVLAITCSGQNTSQAATKCSCQPTPPNNPYASQCSQQTEWLTCDEMDGYCQWKCSK
jgi:hypothetical protein